MKIESTTRFARISPLKVRPLARLLKGLSVADALRATRFNHSKGAALIAKTLKAAIADVENTAKLSADEFHVEQVLVEPGPVMKRYWARSRGMARPVLKRTSHIRVILAKEQ